MTRSYKIAIPIRETPVLCGKDARKFAESARTAAERPVPREAYERARKTLEELNWNTITRQNKNVFHHK